MNQSENPYASVHPMFAADAASDERASFITKTYFHLAGAIVAFVILEAILLNLPITPSLVQSVLGTQYGWLIMLGAFMAVSWIADSWARSSTSLATQYMGLSLYVVAEAIIFVPLLFFAQQYDSNIIGTAAITTVGLFAVLTAIVFITRKDFSFLRSVLFFGCAAAFGLIACGAIFSFALGPIFTYAMIAFACAYILYSTSNVMLHYRTDQYVAASLALFAAVALLFWYIVQLFMSRD